MNKIKAILVDDEKAARNVLSKLLEKYCPKIELLDQCTNVPEAVISINKHTPEVVFLDVEMPEYAGYELINFFDKPNFEIIFITAYDKYAIKAFELSAVDYLLKPINRTRLKEAVDKLSDSLLLKRASEDYKILLESIKERKYQKIVIPELGNKRVLLLEDIIAIEAQRAYSCIHLEKNEKLIVSKNIRYFESVLPMGKDFFRTHRSWVINMKKIKALQKNTGTILMENGLKTKLPKNKYAEFEKLLAQ